MWALEYLTGLGVVLLLLLLLFRSPLAGNVPEIGLRVVLCLGLVLGVQSLLLHDCCFMSNDVDGHYQYLRLLYKDLRVPSPMAGWETYQPPLYFLLALPFYAVASKSAVCEQVEAVRFFSVCCYLIFLLYGLATLRLFVRWNVALYAMAVLLIAWPNGTVLAAKVNNDVLIYPFFVASMYYLSRWHRLDAKADLWRAIGLAIVSVSVKLIGVLLCLGVISLVLLRLVSRKSAWNDIRPGLRTAVLVVVLTLICAAITFGRTYYSRVTLNNKQNYIIGNMNTEAVYVNWPCRILKDRCSNYLVFNPSTFLSEPFFAPRDRSSDSNLFWNSVLKTLLFGNGNGAWKGEAVARATMPFYLALLIYVAVSMARFSFSRKIEFWYLLPLILVSSICVAGLMCLRIRYPLTTFGDARYLYFVVPWLLSALGSAVTEYRECGHRLVAWTGIAIATVLSAEFLVFLTLQWL